MSKRTAQSKSKSKATSTPNVPGFIQGPSQDFYSQVGSLIGGSRNAPTFGATGNQTAAFQGGAQLSGPNAGLSEGMNATRGLLGYTPNSVSAGQLRDADLSAYTNPHENEVVQRSLADIDRMRQGAITGNQAAATGAGAFGGSRHGIADSETNRGAFDAAGRTAAGLRSSGFQSARDAALQDIMNRMNADQFNVSSGLQGAGFRLGAANQLSNQGLAGDANTRANLATQADLGEQERSINQQNDPRNAQMQDLARIAQLLGIDPRNFIGQTQTGRQTGTQSQTGFSVGWSPGGGLSIGG